MMADEEKNEETTEEEGQPEAEAEEAPADDAPEESAEETGAEEPEEAPAEAPAEEPADEPAADAEEPVADEAGGGSDDDDLDWKTRRRLERSRRPAEVRPERSAEERASERAQGRRERAVNRSRYRKGRRAKAGEPKQGTPRAERRPNAAKVRQGIVVSDKADKTITVRIDITRRHPVYEKIVRSSRTLHAHDERNEAGAGDIVRVIESRPISRSKRWRLVEVLEKAK
jgi:small subunit ribosomal protein S17